MIQFPVGILTSLRCWYNAFIRIEHDIIRGNEKISPRRMDYDENQLK